MSRDPRLAAMLLCLVLLPAAVALALRIGPSSASASQATTGGQGRSIHYLQLPTAKVAIGSPEAYAEPGVYTQYRDRHGFYLVTHPSGFMAPISAVCPHDHSGVRYDENRGKYACPTCASRFDRNGPVLGPSAAQRGLERLRLTRIGFYGRKSEGFFVDPHRVFCEDRNEWSKSECMHVFKGAAD